MTNLTFLSLCLNSRESLRSFRILNEFFSFRTSEKLMLEEPDLRSVRL